MESAGSLSSSQQAAQASATPRPFGVSGRWKAPQPSRSASPSFSASLATVAPPRPPGPLQTRTTRSASATAGSLRVVDDRGAVAPRGLDPQVDDRRALDHRHVAEHDDDVGVANRGERQPVGVERAGDLLRQHRLVRVEPDAQQLPERVRLLDRLGAREHRDDAPARLAQQPLGLVDRLLPRNLLETAPAQALQRPREPVPGAQVRVREAALVADPALVDLRVVAGEDPLDLPLAHGRVDVAADRAEAADRRHVDDLPRPPLEAVLRRQERADRAELGHVAGERARVGQVLEGRDHRQRAAVRGDELAVLRDALAEAGAAVAEDAALAVERDRGRDRDRLLEGELLEAHPRVAGAVAEGEVLQRALAALVADRAVERVVDEDELERRVLSLGRLLGRASGASRPSRPAP